MHIKSYAIRWIGRLGIAGANRCLAAIIGVERAKVLNAKIYQKRNLDLKHPRKLNEKLLYHYYRSDLKQMARLTDKYEVRNYICQRGQQEILVPLYGIFNRFDEINFETLPEKFVLKATHGCDMNEICKDKSKLNEKTLRKKVNFWMHCNMAYVSLELHYQKIRPRILCEKYLETKDEIIDYKFHCCNGKVMFVLICTERSGGAYLDVYMPDWTHRPEVIIDAENNPNGIKKPEQFEKMIEIAETLAKELAFVRVDLYEVDRKVYFGELTFTPATGVLKNFSDEFQLEVGDKWNI